MTKEELNLSLDEANVFVKVQRLTSEDIIERFGNMLTEEQLKQIKI